MATLRGRPLAKLLSRHDPARLHATCGATAAAHAAYRAARWFRTGSAGFDGSCTTLYCLMPHAALALTSLRFPLPARRNPAAPMLWPEARAHAVVFSARSLALMLLGWAVLRAPQRAAWLLYARGGVVLATQAAADAASARFAEHRAANGSTIRGMPWPPGVPAALVACGRVFYSVAQLFARCRRTRRASSRRGAAAARARGAAGAARHVGRGAGAAALRRKQVRALGCALGGARRGDAIRAHAGLCDRVTTRQACEPQVQQDGRL